VPAGAAGARRPDDDRAAGPGRPGAGTGRGRPPPGRPPPGPPGRRGRPRAPRLARPAAHPRHALNALEAAALVVTAKGATKMTLGDIEDALQRPRVTYDRAGDQHYDVASAFIKSIRGSDPDAALHYL